MSITPEQVAELATKATPGPWKFEDHGWKVIISKPGDGYITRQINHEVLSLDGSTCCAFRQQDNGRLIAAAPDMAALIAQQVKEIAAYKWAYEYLQGRMESIGRHGWAHDCDDEIEWRCGRKS